LIISGDTLAMHIALGYKIPCIGIFNCTSPSEIYDYGVLQKVTSPLLNDFFYNTQYLKTATEAVSIDEVLHAVSFQLCQGDKAD
jgi:heptosyltransferase II